MWESLLQIPEDSVTIRHVPVHLGWSDVEVEIFSERDREGNMGADEQTKSCATQCEPLHQLMNEHVQKRHVIQTTIWTTHQRRRLMEMLEKDARERDRRMQNYCINARKRKT